jgi:hypothetical protein
MFQGAVIPNCLLRRNDISAGAKLTWARLAQYAGKDGTCYPKRETLAFEIGVHENTLRKYITELVNNGFIYEERPGKKDKLNHKTIRYHFLNHTIFMGDTYEPGDGNSLPPTYGCDSAPTQGCASPPTHGCDSSERESYEENQKKRNQKEKSVDSSGKTDSSHLTSKEKIELALSSYDEYRSYMKLDKVYEKKISDWTAKDFTVFFFCGMANYSPIGPVSLPTWGKDVKIMNGLMKKYGNSTLEKLIVTLLKNQDEITKRIKRKLNVNMSTLTVPWIMDIVADIAFKQDVKRMTPAAIKASKAAEKRAEIYRKQLMEKNNGKKDQGKS